MCIRDRVSTQSTWEEQKEEKSRRASKASLPRSSLSRLSLARASRSKASLSKKSQENIAGLPGLVVAEEQDQELGKQRDPWRDVEEVAFYNEDINEILVKSSRLGPPVETALAAQIQDYIVDNSKLEVPDNTTEVKPFHDEDFEKHLKNVIKLQVDVPDESMMESKTITDPQISQSPQKPPSRISGKRLSRLETTPLGPKTFGETTSFDSSKEGRRKSEVKIPNINLEPASPLKSLGLESGMMESQKMNESAFGLVTSSPMLPEKRIQRELTKLEELGGSFVVVLYTMYPTVIAAALKLFKCSELDSYTGESYLSFQPDIRCWDGPHWFLVLTTGVPSLLIWGVGFPTFWLYFSHRSYKLRDEVMSVIGKFMDYYSKECYFWEAIVYFEKLIVMGITVAIYEFDMDAKVIIVVLTLSIFYFMQLRYLPIIFADMNSLESYSFLVAIFTITVGNVSVEPGNSPGVKFFLQTVIRIFNYIFFIYWTALFITSLFGEKILQIAFVKKALEKIRPYLRRGRKNYMSASLNGSEFKAGVVSKNMEESRNNMSNSQNMNQSFDMNKSSMMLASGFQVKPAEVSS
eukprot:TRINITY_DN8737_c0_g1_i2.p1 TRINITY_DN8737_c0_g1~~TRINITY_DN8737_c0_g1_i2.p1  ORF type:complete len:593 (+),score=142.35 TRINITY_DN8737_c0_g1_i2:47-1780(+)